MVEMIGFLNLDLYNLYKNYNVYLNPDKFHIHPKCTNIEYQNWKTRQNAIIASKIFNPNADREKLNLEQANKGFFD
jgi:hypothetical protein